MATPHQGVAKGREVTARADTPLSELSMCCGCLLPHQSWIYWKVQ